MCLKAEEEGYLMAKKHQSLFIILVFCGLFTQNFSLQSLGLRASEGDEVLLLHFESLDGNTVLDSSSYNNHGTNYRAGLTTGKVGNALYFDGDEDWVEVDDAPSLNVSSAVTISTWVNINSFPKTGLQIGQIIDKHVHKQKGPFGIMIKTGVGVIARFVNTTKTEFNIETSINTGTWYHVVATYGDGQAKLYLNGILKDSITTMGNLMSSNYSIYIGNGVNRDYYFDGAIDEVRVYPRALSEEEVVQQWIDDEEEAAVPEFFNPTLTTMGLFASIGVVTLVQLRKRRR